MQAVRGLRVRVGGASFSWLAVHALIALVAVHARLLMLVTLALGLFAVHARLLITLPLVAVRGVFVRALIVGEVFVRLLLIPIAILTRVAVHGRLHPLRLLREVLARVLSEVFTLALPIRLISVGHLGE